MRVSTDELAARLSSNQSSLPGLLLLNGNEALLIEEALDQARQVLKTLGFSERIKYQAEAGFDWRGFADWCRRWFLDLGAGTELA